MKPSSARSFRCAGRPVDRRVAVEVQPVAVPGAHLRVRRSRRARTESAAVGRRRGTRGVRRRPRRCRARSTTSTPTTPARPPREPVVVDEAGVVVGERRPSPRRGRSRCRRSPGPAATLVQAVGVAGGVEADDAGEQERDRQDATPGRTPPAALVAAVLGARSCRDLLGACRRRISSVAPPSTRRAPYTRSGRTAMMLPTARNGDDGLADADQQCARRPWRWSGCRAGASAVPPTA